MSLERVGRRILVVDDDPGVRELLLTRLQVAGYSVTAARDGADALELVKMVSPAAMVLDLNMPGTDGFDVLSALQLNRATARLPVMVLTARNAPDDVKRVLQLGARDYLAKPFDDQMLLARVARLLRTRTPVAAQQVDAAPKAKPQPAPVVEPVADADADNTMLI